MKRKKIKQWWEDYNISTLPGTVSQDNLKAGMTVTVSLPYAANTKEWSFYFNVSELKKASELTGILMSAFDQINRDNPKKDS